MFEHYSTDFVMYMMLTTIVGLLCMILYFFFLRLLYPIVMVLVTQDDLDSLAAKSLETRRVLQTVATFHQDSICVKLPDWRRNVFYLMLNFCMFLSSPKILSYAFNGEPSTTYAFSAEFWGVLLSTWYICDLSFQLFVREGIPSTRRSMYFLMVHHICTILALLISICIMDYHGGAAVYITCGIANVWPFSFAMALQSGFMTNLFSKEIWVRINQMGLLWYPIANHGVMLVVFGWVMVQNYALKQKWISFAVHMLFFITFQYIDWHDLTGPILFGNLRDSQMLGRLYDSLLLLHQDEAKWMAVYLGARVRTLRSETSLKTYQSDKSCSGMSEIFSISGGLTSPKNLSPVVNQKRYIRREIELRKKASDHIHIVEQN